MKTHKDFLSVIGTTHAVSYNKREKRANAYYHRTYEKIVTLLLEDVLCRETLIDIGTSHGHWLPYFQRMGFQKILGIELDEKRARQAQANGYDQVFVGDAMSIPQPDRSIDVAISNDVFVHILQMDDKKAVIREVERILKDGGIFIVNHTMANAYGYNGYAVDRYSSYLSLNEFKELFQGTAFDIVEIKPTYFNFRDKANLWIKSLTALVRLPVPFGIELRLMLDYFLARILPMEKSDVVYIKAILNCEKLK